MKAITWDNMGAGKLVRTGVGAIALTIAGLGIIGGGSAFADGPRSTSMNQSVNQSMPANQAKPGLLTKVATTKVVSMKASSSGTDKTAKSCAHQANFANDLQTMSDAYAEAGDYETSFDLAKQANDVVDKAVSNGCVVIWQ